MTTEEKLQQAYKEFWFWFQKNEKRFHKIIKSKNYIEQGFLDPLSIELDKIKEGFYFLVGMEDENTVDLMFTAESKLKNIHFVEELVKAAPKSALKGWSFKTLKQETDISEISVEMNGYKFNTEKISFYPVQNSDYPDEIEITIIHQDFTTENEDIIINGIYIFLDNYLGELNFATNIDVLHVIGTDQIEVKNEEIIPIEKLKNYLIWREKEYVEKYEGFRESTEKDNYSLLQAKLPNGKPLFALINIALLDWERKASHRYITVLSINFEKTNKNENDGLPNEETSDILNNLEDGIIEKLKQNEGHLSIGRETSNDNRNIYFASKDFRTPSKIMYQIQEEYSDKFEIEYDIFVDKYWQSFERFRLN